MGKEAARKNKLARKGERKVLKRRKNELDAREKQIVLKEDEIEKKRLELLIREKTVTEKEHNLKILCEEPLSVFLKRSQDYIDMIKEQNYTVMQLCNLNNQTIVSLVEIHRKCYLNEEMRDSDIMSQVCELLVRTYGLIAFYPSQGDQFNYEYHVKFSYKNTTSIIERCIAPGWKKESISNDTVYLKALVKTTIGKEA